MSSQIPDNERAKQVAKEQWEDEVKPFLDQGKPPGWIINRLCGNFIGADHASFVETLCDLTYEYLVRKSTTVCYGCLKIKEKLRELSK